jgi:hypothetical protein
MKALAGAGMELQVRGGACNVSARNLMFTLDSTSLELGCKYVRTTATGPVKGTYNTDESGQDAVETFIAGANTTFVRTESSVFCPEKIEWEMKFTLETEDGSPLFFKNP